MEEAIFQTFHQRGFRIYWWLPWYPPSVRTRGVDTSITASKTGRMVIRSGNLRCKTKSLRFYWHFSKVLQVWFLDKIFLKNAIKLQSQGINKYQWLQCCTVISKMNNIIALHCLMLTEHIRNQYNTAPDKSFKTIIQERCAVLIWAKGSGSDWNGVILLVFNNIKFCWGKVVS